ncbi:sterol desaturase family protein [Methylocystis iwaonis]|uniref:sterol desaturase family protein n=1 Tax=Methylocystis iwaonis TaxID=2885079 RepID=UPI002E7B350C|nr:sterol desaturase family protein [Methylocystis iwaonis]
MQWLLQQLSSEILSALQNMTTSLLAGGAIFTALALVPGVACNPGKPWWRNRGLATDGCYLALNAILAMYLSTAVAIALALTLTLFLPAVEIIRLLQGNGLFARFPLAAQCALYLAMSDFLLYWIHRGFHCKILWPFHAIHHASEDVDWTSGYRMHPINLALSAHLVPLLMLYLGIPLEVIILLAPLDTAVGYFVHSNLNWTLGPLKYVIATPVFHRWHHTRSNQGGAANFAPTFAIWDVLFGTFFMPAGALPARYGIDDQAFPPRFTRQLVYPFEELLRLIGLRKRLPPVEGSTL